MSDLMNTDNLYKTEYKSLFSTPLWCTQLVSEHSTFNEQLFNARRNIKPGMDYFDIDDNCVSILKDHIVNFVNQSLMTYYDTTESFLHDIIVNGRQNPIKPLGLDTPHHHPGMFLVGVYYIKVPERSGDILFHDPRNGIRWEDPILCSLQSDKTDMMLAKELGEITPPMFRPFHRLTPKPGQLIVFPGYLTHQVETNLSNDLRMSVAVTINLKSRKH